MYRQNFDCAQFTLDFTKNARNCKYKMVKALIFCGNVLWLRKHCFNTYRTFAMQLRTIDGDDHGQLDKNACFNKLGLLVHDIAFDFIYTGTSKY